MRYLAFLAVFAEETSEAVVTLTDATLEAWVATNDPCLVEFYAPWCGHCKNLAPEYEKAAQDLQNAGSPVKLAKVDATEEKESAEKYGVEGFPTLKWFVGGEAVEYDGGRTATTIVEWITMMTSPAVSLEAPGEPKGKPQVILWGPTLSKSFEDAAQANRQGANYFFVESPGEKITLQHPGEDLLELAVTDQVSIQKFVKENTVPLVGNLNVETFSSYMESAQGLIWCLYPMEEEDEVDTIRSAHFDFMKQVAVSTKGRYHVTYTDTNEFKQAIEGMLGVTDFPAIVVQKKASDKKKFIFEGEITVENVIQYVADIEAGRIVAKLKSEPIPEDDDTAVKVVVGDNLEKVVFQPDKDVLLEIYAPWCGHCKKLEPDYEKVAKKVVKEQMTDLLVIAKMDGTANDSPVDAIEWSGFPTIFYVKAGQMEPMSFDGDRSAKGIWKWIKKHSSFADEIKARLAKNKAEGEEEDKTPKEEL